VLKEMRKSEEKGLGRKTSMLERKSEKWDARRLCDRNLLLL
jgi:hypothetical protein